MYSQSTHIFGGPKKQPFLMWSNLIKSDEMGELLSAIETKKAFGDFDEELGKKWNIKN